MNQAWSRNPGVWLPAAVFVLANVLALAIFTGSFADNAEAGLGRLERRAEQLAQLKAKRSNAEEAVFNVRTSSEGLKEFYGDRLAPESEALTRIIAEVKDLANRAGLPPSSISYSKEQLEGQSLIRRSLEFSVSGTYEQLRQLVNLLELSDSFLILEQVNLQGSNEGDPVLGISLSLSTLFTVGDAEIVLLAERQES